MYPKSRCLSKLPEAFKLAVKPLQSWHFQHGFENALPLSSPKCQELFRTFDLFFSCREQKGVPVTREMKQGKLLRLPSVSHDTFR